MRKRGFTLIELLVVIAIIGILAVIIILNVSNAADKSRYAKAKSELKAINEAVSVAYIDGKYNGGDNTIESNGNEWEQIAILGYNVTALEDADGTKLIPNIPEPPSGGEWTATNYWIKVAGNNNNMAGVLTPDGWCIYQAGNPILVTDETIGSSGSSQSAHPHNCEYGTQGQESEPVESEPVE